MQDKNENVCTALAVLEKWKEERNEDNLYRACCRITRNPVSIYFLSALSKNYYRNILQKTQAIGKLQMYARGKRKQIILEYYLLKKNLMMNLFRS